MLYLFCPNTPSYEYLTNLLFVVHKFYSVIDLHINQMLKFLPAGIVCLLSLTIGVQEEMLVRSITKFYPLMVAMIFGSMIAGSTPLGGGVVAFPVTVLILNFSPAEGRDFSLLIQSIGMTAASFLIFTEKESLWKGCGNIMAVFCFFACVGLIVGFHIQSMLSPFLVNICYTTSVACFAIVLAGMTSRNATLHVSYKEEITPKIHDAEDDQNIMIDSIQENKIITLSQSDSKNRIDDQKVTLETTRFRLFLVWFGLAISGIIGGVLSAQIGTGADIAWYAYGSLLNSSSSVMGSITQMNKSQQHGSGKLSENALTAISVIVMACTSVNGSILRITASKSTETSMINSNVYEAFLACSFIVVFGAPIGSTFLTPVHQKRLTALFYIFAALQLILFGVIKIKRNGTAWMFISISLVVAFLISLRIKRVKLMH